MVVSTVLQIGDVPIPQVLGTEIAEAGEVMGDQVRRVQGHFSCVRGPVVVIIPAPGWMR